MPTADVLDELATDLREQLVAAPASRDGELRQFVHSEAALLGENTRQELIKRIETQSFGLGRLEPLLADPAIDEVMVQGVAPVWIESHGTLRRTDVAFESETQLRETIDRILTPIGRRVDEAQPLVDARLRDGSRINVVIPPLAIDGSVLTIRRFRRDPLRPEDLIAAGTLTESLLEYLASAVAGRHNILICGGTGSGKTTTLGALSSCIADHERVITIEDSAELRLAGNHVVRLECRLPNLEGRGAVTIRDLVRNALRMRPDRIIVGEVRGGEALDMLTALTTGHAGSMTTIHAGTPTEALRRLETLALMAELDLPHAAIRTQVADAIDLVVCQLRLDDGRRVIANVAEVTRTAGNPGMREIYRLGEGADGWVQQETLRWS